MTLLTSDQTALPYLRELSKLHPSIDSALATIAVLSSSLTLPKGTIHVISDVHGEYKKLRHVVNNASGSLRPLVTQLFSPTLSNEEQLQLLSFIYYPRESFLFYFQPIDSAADRRKLVIRLMRSKLEIVRSLATNYSLHHVAALLPTQYLQLFRELILSPQFHRDAHHFEALIDSFLTHSRELDLLRLTARLIRNLAISELVVAGDMGDRGPRIDKSIDFLTRQPHVSITWGNHDTSWMGACLGDLLCIATVIRLSLRYGRVTQLEEGYGIPLDPLERLVAHSYADDPATRFECKDSGGRDRQLLARMQKAIAVLQWKLESQTIARNPHFNLSHRDLLMRVDWRSSVASLDGKDHPLLDKNFPTINPDKPADLTSEEERCLTSLKSSFINSPVLWKHMTFLARKGHMALIRDHALIFHGCVPCDEAGNFLSLSIDGNPCSGRTLFDAIEVVVQRTFQSPQQRDLDLLWYLWCGPLSPLFGKDKIATFESYLIADKDTHHEHKNPYFNLIHESWFCEKVLAEFGAETNDGIIVNGHVPVKIEQGESPLKRSGKAVTIDGAFSEAYGDKGYTLVMQPDRTYLALHHHFDSVSDSIQRGTDMIPECHDIRVYPQSRTINDSEQGVLIRNQIALLELLIKAYVENKIEQQ